MNISIHHSSEIKYILNKLDETEIDLSKVTPKLLYKNLKLKKQTPPSAENKMKYKYPQLLIDWKKNLFFTAYCYSRNKNQWIPT